MKVKICEQCKTYNSTDEWSCQNCGADLSVDTIAAVSDTDAVFVLKINKAITNKVLHVKLSGGIVGFLAANPRVALEKTIREANADGWHVVQVVNDDTGNLLVWLSRLIILLLTFFIWTPINGYFVVVQRERVEYQGK